MLYFLQARLNQQAALQIQGQNTNQLPDSKQGQVMMQSDGNQKQSPSQTPQATSMHSVSSMQQQQQQQGLYLNVNGPLGQHMNEHGIQKQGQQTGMGLSDSWNKPTHSQQTLMHPNSNPNMAGHQMRFGGEQTLSVVNGLGSTSEFSNHQYPTVSSTASPLLSPKSTHLNGSHPNYSQPLSISNPANSLLSPGIVSPHLLSPHQPLLSPNTPKMGSNTNGYKIPKLSLLYDPKDVPRAPSPPQPKLPLDRLNPPTPSITVGTL